MSRHEGVSCDSCLKSNFPGRRYKCLICYDYDLCANCYEEGATSTRHSADHPMQCILTRADFEIYYGGEVISADQPQSFTCPYCKKMGFSDATLFEHVGNEHTETGMEVVCPVCAALPGGEPNLVTDDFAGHLSLEHRTAPRDLISFLDEPSAIRHGGIRRIPHSNRALGGPRSRRSNMHFSSTTGFSALSPSGREAVDPIAELLSQLSGVRRGAPQSSNLQQIQMQIQLERQQASASRQQLERLPRRHPVVSSANSSNIGIGGSGGLGNGVGPLSTTATSAVSSSTSHHNTQANVGCVTITSANGQTRESQVVAGMPMLVSSSSGAFAPLNQNGQQSQFLLTRFMAPNLDDSDLAQIDCDRADRSQYVQALLLSTLSNMDAIEKEEAEIERSKQQNSMVSIPPNEPPRDDDCTTNREETRPSSGQQQQQATNHIDDLVNSEELDTQNNHHQLNYLQQSQLSQRSVGIQSVRGGKQLLTNAGANLSNNDRRSGSGGGGGGVGGRPSSQSSKARELKQQQQSTVTPSSKEVVPDSR